MSYLRESWQRPLVLSGDMLRDRGLVLLTTIFYFIYKVSAEEITNSNGWIPMSHNDIYNQMRRVSTKYPIYLDLKPSTIDEDNFVKTQMNTKKDFEDFEASFELLSKKPFKTVIVADNIKKSNLKLLNVLENSRKSKTVYNHFNNENILDLPEIDSLTNIINEEKSINDDLIVTATSKSYEVTENTLATEDNYTTENVGYQYNLPTDENQNLTSTFHRILSKYNINSKDKLRNYDLSLQHKVQSPPAGVYRVPLLYGYNNLNHLPVDPLLAVFLSNYGVYLPSLYGIKGNYNNLYGYLASNNIHNNKPFGMYKVFSDTDSWH